MHLSTLSICTDCYVTPTTNVEDPAELYIMNMYSHVMIAMSLGFQYVTEKLGMGLGTRSNYTVKKYFLRLI